MTRKILIIDESEQVRDILAETLHEAGCEVCASDNAEEALGLVEAKEYDLLLTDIRLQQLDGIAFISEVRKIPGRRFLPIVVLSGEEKEKCFIECARAGASGYLQKPLEKDEIIQVIEKIIPY